MMLALRLSNTNFKLVKLVLSKSPSDKSFLLNEVKQLTTSASAKSALRSGSTKKLKNVLLSTLQKRFVESDSSPPVKPLNLRVLSWSLFTLGLTSGLLLGYLTRLNDQFYSGRSPRILILSHPNPVPIHHGPAKEVEHSDSVYSQFPLNITLYQYETSPLSKQIRSYLDYFGFTYNLIEVDPYSKSEVKSFEKHPHVPICVLEDKQNDRHWFLYDAPTIMSALETLRNENYSEYYRLIPKYLPIIVHLDELSQDLRYPNRYIVSEKSDLNDISARKWIDRTVIPVFNWNTSDSKAHAKEAVKMFADRCNWRDRFSALKRWYLQYTYANVLYAKHDEFKHEIQHLDPDRYSDPMDAVHDVISRWEKTLNDDRNQPFHGAETPDLADLSMFGAISAYEGCELFREALNGHPQFFNWFNHMENYINENFGGTSYKSPHTLDWIQIKDEAFKKARSLKDEVLEGASSLADKVKSGIGLAAGKVTDAASTVAYKAKKRTEGKEDFIEKGKEAAGAAAEVAKDQAGYMYERGKDKLNEKLGKASDMASRGKEKAQEMTRKPKEEASSLYERGKENLLETLESSAEKATTRTDRRGDLKQRILETSSSLFAPTGEEPEEPYLDPELDLDVKSREAVGLISGKATDMTKTMGFKAKRKAGKLVEEAKEEANELVEKGKAKVNELSERVSEEASDLKHRAVEGVTAAKDKVTETASEVTNKAVDKTKQAIQAVNEKIGETASEAKNKAKEKVDEMKNKMSEEATYVADKTKEGASLVASKTKEKMSQFADIVQEEARQFVGTIQHESENISKDADQVIDQAKKDVNKVKGNIKERAHEIADETKTKAASFANKVNSFVNEHEKRKGKNKVLNKENNNKSIDSDDIDDVNDLKGFRVLVFSYLSLLSALSYVASHVKSKD